MQFTLLSVFSLLAIAMASELPIQARQSAAVSGTTPDVPAANSGAPATQDAVMTDVNGNVLAFNAAGVYQAAQAAGI